MFIGNACEVLFAYIRPSLKFNTTVVYSVLYVFSPVSVSESYLSLSSESPQGLLLLSHHSPHCECAAVNVNASSDRYQSF